MNGYNHCMGEISVIGPCLVKLALMKSLHQHWCLEVADQCSVEPPNKIRMLHSMAKYIEILLTSDVYSTSSPEYVTIYSTTKTKKTAFFFHCLLHRGTAKRKYR